MVYLDRIFILAEPALQVEGSSEEALQEAKRNRVKVLFILLSVDKLFPRTRISVLGFWAVVDTLAHYDIVN